MLRMKWRGLAVAGLFAVIATSAYGFAATNTVPGSRAGDGSGSISGYNVTNIRYTLGAANPGRITAVRFRLNGPATTVRIQVGPGATWYSCVNTTANRWRCPTTPGVLTVASAANLRVVAVE